MPLDLERLLAGQRRYAIRRAADGDQHALDYLLRDFIRGTKQGRALDPEVARVAAEVLERVLAGENIGEILGTKAKRGAPRKYGKAILVHAMVRRLMRLRSQQTGRARRRPRGSDAKTEVAEILGMSLETVQENYKRVARLIKNYPAAKDDPFSALAKSGLSLLEKVYLMDQENAVFLLDFGQAAASGSYVALGRTEMLADIFRRRMEQFARRRGSGQVSGRDADHLKPHDAKGRKLTQREVASN